MAMSSGAVSVERSTLAIGTRRVPDLLFGVVNGHDECACDLVGEASDTTSKHEIGEGSRRSW